MNKESKPIEVGDYIYYIPYADCDKSLLERGRVKSIKSPDEYFVVYNCNNDWNNYTEYTGQLTNIKNIL